MALSVNPGIKPDRPASLLHHSRGRNRPVGGEEAAPKKYSVEQIIAKLRELRSSKGRGCRSHRRRRSPAVEYLGTGKRPPEENCGGSSAGHLDAEGPTAGKMASPERRRAAVSYLMKRHAVSERKACQLVDQNRSTQRYQAPAPEEEIRLVRATNELATKHPRWYYRMVWQLFRSDGWKVNRKRIERRWRLEGHRVPPAQAKDSGKKAEGNAGSSAWIRRAERANHIWSYDFMSDWTRRGGPIRILNIVDEFTRVVLRSHVSRSIGSNDLKRVLAETFERHGRPTLIRSDNGREFIATTEVEWLAEQGVEAVFIEKGKPQQNGSVERFNGSMRREILNVEDFDTVLESVHWREVRAMLGPFLRVRRSHTWPDLEPVAAHAVVFQE
jgi:putative transposase